MDERLKLSIARQIAWVVIDRHEKRNALDAAMVDSLIPICREIERSNARVAVLSGAGGRCFCAGGDIGAWSALSPEKFSRHWLRDGHAAFDALARLSVPLIAVLNGDCLGGGLELAACADYRIAEVHAKFGLPEAGLGIIPGWSGTQRAVRRFGAQAVRRMALMGEIFDAYEARRLGLVDKIVAKGSGAEAAGEAATRVITRAPRASELVKALINAAEGEERERTLEFLAGAVAAGDVGLAEGLAAFREKRKPRFDVSDD